MRTLAIAIAALALAAVSPGRPDAKTTHHAATNAKPAARSAASPITRDQAEAVAELAKTGLAIQADLNGAIASVSADEMSRRRGRGDDPVLVIECFQVLEGATVELTGNLKELLVATATASLAEDRRDLDTSMGFTRLALQDVGDSVVVVEQATSAQTPACRSSRFYRDQVSSLQTFTHDVTSVTDDLSAAAIPK